MLTPDQNNCGNLSAASDGETGRAEPRSPALSKREKAPFFCRA